MRQKKIKLDLRNAKSEVIDADEYIAFVNGVSPTLRGDSALVTFLIFDESANHLTTITDDFRLDAVGAKKLTRFLIGIGTLTEDDANSSETYEFDINDVVGKDCVVEIVVRENKNGDEVNEIRRYLPLEDSSLKQVNGEKNED